MSVTTGNDDAVEPVRVGAQPNLAETIGPDTVTAIADELFELLADADPINATLLGLPGRDHLLADIGEAAQLALRDQLTALLTRVDALGGETQSGAGQDALTAAVVRHEAEAAIGRVDARLVEYTITDLFFAPAAELLAMLPMAGLDTPERARAYAARLAAVPALLDQAAQRHLAGVAAGRLPVARLVARAVRQLDEYLDTATPDPLARLADAEQDEVLETAVRPAFARYRQVLAEQVAPHARPDERPGLCWLPDGAAVYRNLVRAHTTTDRTPEELHETGLALMAGLEREYADLGGRVFGSPDFRATLARLRNDTGLRWDNEEELLAAARAAIARAEAAAPRWFARLPGSRCAVSAVPEASAAAAPAAYYVPPALDGSRPGTYFANTSRVRERDRVGLEAIAFHEGVPGHHLQLALAQELTHLPMLRRTGTLTAYAEGWGLYAERLADEMGLYSDDLARLGMLSADSRRSARLVVDTGLHALGWSRGQAVAYLLENTARPRVEIETDVDRFIAWPGQSLAYLVGRLEFQRARAQAQQTLGARFDVRAFHDLVLGNGALPLSALSAIVAQWTEEFGH
ncbi:DUF885 domain-containing protein [Amycolatopsis halotolerans]|uniref:DUF885 domain-containing protein n=1 Tax=Amycolatopsis halotolerans TaxID=330083 RepID=A0ABV7QB76_9PSEU